MPGGRAAAGFVYEELIRTPPPLLKSPPPCHLGPESIGNTRRQRHQRKILQGAKGAEADLHCDTMVQICGAVPPKAQWLLEAPVRKIILQMHTPARSSQCWSRQTPAWTRSVHLDAPGQRHGQQPVSGTADPGVVKQDKSSRGSVDTTKTRSGPQRVRMSSGERPIGAARGKQSKGAYRALCVRCAKSWLFSTTGSSVSSED